MKLRNRPIWLVLLASCLVLLSSPWLHAAVTYSYDDGVSEEVLGGGPPQPADLWWVQGFTAQPGCDIITSIEIAYGRVASGRPVQLLLYEDPTDDLDPTDAVLLTSVSTTVMQPDADQFISVPIPPTSVSGDFFVGALMWNNLKERPLALDETSSKRALWVAENTNGINLINPANVNASVTFGPVLADSIGFPGNALLRATAVPEPAALSLFLGLLGWMAAVARRR